MARPRVTPSVDCRDSYMLAGAFCLIAAATASLSMLGFWRTYKAFTSTARRLVRRQEGDREAFLRVAIALKRATRCAAFRPTCLRVALASHVLLASVGVDNVVKIGVRRAEGGLVAHAWVVCEYGSIDLSSGWSDEFAIMLDSRDQPQWEREASGP